MNVPVTRALRRIAAGLGALLVVLLSLPAAPVRAASSSLDVGDQAVVNVVVRGKGNELTVRVWDRPTVQVDYAEDAVPSIARLSIPFGTVRFPLSQQIPAQLFTLHDRDGAITGAGALPPEEFPYASFRPGPHDTVRIDAPEGSHLVVTVPAALGILALRVGGGQTSVEGYRGANLFLAQNQGRVQLTGTSTSAFVQVNYGVFYAADGTFDRIRVRGIAAHDLFERCRSKQIEATSINGSILYDGGSFDPGLARFESQNGNIALGVVSPAQLAAHSDEGHVYTAFDKRANVDQHGDGTATATVGGGGALVNAITGRGNVFLYDGSLASRRAPNAEWRPLHQLFNQHRRAAAPRPEGPRRSRTVGRLRTGG
ncbi:MAG: hypothetical protein JO083_01095 [Candidatus Eremiobacteraeota bacterium]|nr:hypothetical protein [Candidatus Eremiobacteraeota bacterium]